MRRVRVAFAFREYLLGIYGYFYGLFLHKQGMAWPMIIIDPTRITFLIRGALFSSGAPDQI